MRPSGTRKSGKNRKCPSGKVRFRDQHEATQTLKRARAGATFNDKRQESRTYQCGLCNGGWHLTSQPYRLGP